ncbi:FAD/NAD(P)-binding domain-containing protein [Polyplosphaeria fusca]|uniref:FAD/NAD(P)-binding domain-containing protein n=1 Tax=Polyplosphaeria fusca TaxID=682080 RepID=A0A9P4R0S2_9PLEO|nr:FAD/NAD(P)-binding domain-containing protein [Polyplosphaeria fusca]
MAKNHYDALVLGSGQAGTPLATHLQSLSLSTCLVERSHIAGCCVNEGCTPTKTMVASGRVAYLARRAGDYGVSAGNGEVKVDMQKVRQRKRDIVNSFRGGSERRLKDSGVDVLMGEASFVSPNEVSVKLNDGGETTVSADKIYINVGCRPSRPSIPGLDDLDQSRVLDSTSIQELGEVPEHLAVLGGGYIGLEFAQLFRRLGAKVTIIHRSPRLLSKLDDPELVDCLTSILKEDGITMHLSVPHTTLSPSPSSSSLPITLKTPTTTLHASHLLLATGRTPNTSTLSLASANISLTPTGHIPVSPTLSTTTSHIFALGDVKPGPAFTHISYDDFRILRSNLSSSGTSTTHARDKRVPSVVYTDPQFGHVGPKFGALPRGRYVSYSMPGGWVARGLETGETRGMMKGVVDAGTGEVVSFGAIGVEGGEVMGVVQMAMVGGVGWEGLRDMVFAHPSWGESLNNVWGGERREFVVE